MSKRSGVRIQHKRPIRSRRIRIQNTVTDPDPREGFDPDPEGYEYRTGYLWGLEHLGHIVPAHHLCRLLPHARLCCRVVEEHSETEQKIFINF